MKKTKRKKPKPKFTLGQAMEAARNAAGLKQNQAAREGDRGQADGVAGVADN
jgi:hypothetical protein